MFPCLVSSLEFSLSSCMTYYNDINAHGVRWATFDPNNNFVFTMAIAMSHEQAMKTMQNDIPNLRSQIIRCLGNIITHLWNAISPASPSSATCSPKAFEDATKPPHTLFP